MANDNQCNEINNILYEKYENIVLREFQNNRKQNNLTEYYLAQ